MAIKSIHDKVEPEKMTTTYPMLMRNTITGLVVVFSDRGVGTVVYPDVNNALGLYRDDWVWQNFVPLAQGESVTLSNVWEVENAS